MAMEHRFEVSLEPRARPAKQPENRMFPAARSVHRFLLSTFCLLLLGSPTMAQEAKSIIALREGKGGDAPRVKRVLILHALGRDFAPFNALSSSFRTALAEQSATPIEFFEASLESTLFAEDEFGSLLSRLPASSVRQSTGGLGCANRRPGTDVLAASPRQTVSRGSHSSCRS